MDLETGCCIDPLEMLSVIFPQIGTMDTHAPDTTELIPRTGLKDDSLEAMADTMRCCSYTCQSSTNNSNSRSVKPLAGRGRIRCKNLCEDELP